MLLMNELERLEFGMKLQNMIYLKEKIPLPYAALLAHRAVTTFDPRVMKGVEMWMDDRLTDAFSVGEVTLGELREAYGGCSAFVALNVLDLLLKDPDAVFSYTWFEGVDEVK